MRCYFLSKRRCALKLNGEFLGYAGNNPAFTELDELNGFCEFIPLSVKLLPCNAQLKSVLLNEKNLSNVRIIDLYGDFLVLPSFKRALLKGELFFADNLGDGVYACVFNAGAPQAFIQTNAGGGVFNLGDCDCDKFEFKLLNGFLLLTATTPRDKKSVFLFDIKNAPRLYLKRECDEFVLGEQKAQETLTLTTKNIGVCKLQKREVINLTEPTSSYLAFARGVQISELSEALLPYAFLEEVFLNANYSDYLSRDLCENKDFIPDFIGDFEFFLPPLKAESGIILIKNNKEKADFLRITSKNGCITDLNLL